MKSDARVRSSPRFRIRISLLGFLSGLGFRASVFLFIASALAAPISRIQPAQLDEVRWTRGFWADEFELCRTQMVPAMWRLMEGTNYTQFFRNFEIAAGLVEGRSRGASFNDGDFYKWLEAAAATLAVTNDPDLAQTVDHVIDVMGQAQRADGYLNTPTLIRIRNGDTNAAPFADRGNFEMYNLGHLFTTAAVHHQVTGKTNLLGIAIRAADFLDRSFSNATPESARSPVCPSHYMGLVDLYRATHESRYLQLAEKLFQLRSEVKNGGDDNQDRIPFLQQTNAMGHAVRANYLYCGAADLFMETGDTNFWNPLEPIWTNVVEQKMYITGGCGALFDGASPDGARNQGHITRVHQAYGRNYQLPNTTAHNETCANIANAMWNRRMFQITGEGRFMDVAELALYNSVLSGVDLQGTNFFYTNPLRVTDPMPTELRWSRTRVPFVGSFCCPPNVVRTIAEIAEYAYSKSRDAIWVNLYGGNTFSTTLENGERVRLNQQTEYPWSGRVRIRIEECGVTPFAVKLRIPGWTTHAEARVNDGAPICVNRAEATENVAHGYLELRRSWNAGDVIDLDLPMPVRLMEAHPLVEEDFNQLAVQRGPIVYCVESVDLPKGVDVLNVALPDNVNLRARYDQRLLGGIVVLEGIAESELPQPWTNRLYRVAQPEVAKPIKLTMIPYAFWQNRGESEMTVWLQRGERHLETSKP